MLSGLAMMLSRGAASGGEDLSALARLAGSMVMMGFRGADPGAPGARAIADRIRRGQIGGVIFFEDNLASPKAARDLTHFFAQAGGDARPLIGIDQEGGAVARLRVDRGFRPLPSARRTAEWSETEARRAYGETAAELHDLGFNVNFAPVVDLDLNPANPIIGALGRSFGADPERVIARAELFIEAHREHHVLTALKHFPGHGSSAQDSHRTLPDITHSWRDIEEVPFVRLANSGLADMIMAGHLMHADLTEPGRPASLSRRVVEDRLRGRINYKGVVVSDDMQMGALRRFYPPDDSIRLGLEAGLDLLVFTNREHPDPEMPDRFHRVVKEAVAGHRLEAHRIEESAKRIEALKSGLV